MLEIEEGQLIFQFADTWECIKYDADGGYYRQNLLIHVDDSKAIDFLLVNSKNLLMIEVKDYRQTSDSPDYDKLPSIIATKVRDSIAGIIGGSLQASDSKEKQTYLTAYRRLSRPPTVIFLFIERNKRFHGSEKQSRKAIPKRGALSKKLRTQLRWLTKKVLVVGLDNYKICIPDTIIRDNESGAQQKL